MCTYALKRNFCCYLKWSAIMVSLLPGICSHSRAQGCSDAGVCTSSMLRGDDVRKEEGLRNAFSVGISYGKADFDIGATAAFLEFSRLLGNRWQINLRLTAARLANESYEASGPGDLYTTLRYAIHENLSVNAGVKWPLSNGNLKDDEIALPFDYQPSLGTIDVLLGAQLHLGRILLGLAWQQSLGETDNDAPPPIVLPNPGTNLFSYRRKGDLALRAMYLLPLEPRWKLGGGVLPILHLGDDTYRDRTTDQLRVVPGSGSWTLNANALVEYLPGARHLLRLQAGAPLRVRPVRPDGLTRSFAAEFSYQFHF